MLKISKLDHYGRGITRLNDKICFVYNALPEEEVLIEKVGEKKKYIVAKVSELKKISPKRIEVKCPYYLECGGCDLLHLEYEEQLKFKQEKVKEILKKFSEIDIDNIDISHSKNYFYRNKVTLKVIDNNLAYHKKNSNDLVKIDKCLLVDEVLNEVIVCINKYLKENINFEEIILKINNKKEILIEIKGKVNLNNFLKYLENFNVKSVFVDEKCVFGSLNIKMDIFDKKFNLTQKAFFQVNKYLIETLYSKVIDYIKNKKINKALDLYSGTSTISILISKYVKKVIAVEENKEAIKNAKENLKLNGISNVEVINAKVEEKIDSYNNIDLVIVDPPRNGLDKKVVKALLKLKPKYLCYISCDPITFARDLKDLNQIYKIKNISLVDMFSNSYHIETVCLLKLTI